MGQVSSGSGEVVESYGYTASGVLAFAAGGGLEREQGVASSPRTGPAQVRGQDKITVRGTVVTGQGRTRYRYDRAGQMVGHRRTRLSRPAETTGADIATNFRATLVLGPLYYAGLDLEMTARQCVHIPAGPNRA